MKRSTQGNSKRLVATKCDDESSGQRNRKVCRFCKGRFVLQLYITTHRRIKTGELYD